MNEFIGRVSIEFVILLIIAESLAYKLYLFVSGKIKERRKLKRAWQYFQERQAAYKQPDMYISQYKLVEKMTKLEKPTDWYLSEIQALGDMYGALLTQYRIYYEWNCKIVRQPEIFFRNSGGVDYTLDPLDDGMKTICMLMKRLPTISANLELVKRFGYESVVLEIYDSIKTCLGYWRRRGGNGDLKHEISLALQIIDEGLSKLREDSMASQQDFFRLLFRASYSFFERKMENEIDYLSRKHEE